MVFTTPCKYQNKLIPDFSIDTTSFLNNEGFCAPTSIKISLCVKNLSKQQILNLEISIETDSETIVLSQKELLYIEPVKNDIMVRFESFISPEQMAHLVSKGIKSINIKKSKNETIAAFNGKKLNKKLLFLSKTYEKIYKSLYFIYLSYSRRFLQKRKFFKKGFCWLLGKFFHFKI